MHEEATTILRALEAKLDDMQIVVDDTGDPVDYGYQCALEELRSWVAAQLNQEAAPSRSGHGAAGSALSASDV